MSALTKRGKPRRAVSAGASARERILLHTDRSGECWIWTGAVGDSGYGRMVVARDSKQALYAHRVSYEVFVGPIRDGQQIDHLCRVRRCVNPHHLEQVDPQTNVLRGFSPGAIAQRRELCLYGHSYAEHGVVRSGRRVCRPCRTAYARLYRQVPFAEAMRRKSAGEPIVDLAAYWLKQLRQEGAA